MQMIFHSPIFEAKTIKTFPLVSARETTEKCRTRLVQVITGRTPVPVSCREPTPNGENEAHIRVAYAYCENANTEVEQKKPSKTSIEMQAHRRERSDEQLYHTARPWVESSTTPIHNGKACFH